MLESPASITLSISFLLALAKPITSVLSPASSKIFLVAIKSPSEEAGNPASITSTPNLTSWPAIFTFCSTVKSIPGACSPSLNVVSSILTLFENTHPLHQFINLLKFYKLYCKTSFTIFFAIFNFSLFIHEMGTSAPYQGLENFPI